MYSAQTIFFKLINTANKVLNLSLSHPTHTHTHTHTHTSLTALCKTNLDFTGARVSSGSGISWAICKSALRSRQTTTQAPHHSVFYRPDALPAIQPTASKHWRLCVESTVHKRLPFSSWTCQAPVLCKQVLSCCPASRVQPAHGAFAVRLQAGSTGLGNVRVTTRRPAELAS